MKRFFSALTVVLICMLVYSADALGAGIKMSILKGAGQQVQVGRKAPEPIILKILDENDRPLSTSVKFSVVKGEGSLSASSVKTDGAGLVRVDFIAGLSAGTSIIKAEIPGNKDLFRHINITVTFDNPVKKQGATPKASPAKSKTGNGSPKPAPDKPAPAVKETPKPTPVKPQTGTGRKPAIVIGFAGGGQKLLPGKKGSSRLEVQIMDDQGNILPGVRVDFEVTQGPALLGDSSAVTDSKGIAGVTVRGGATEGQIAVKAKVHQNEELSTVFYLSCSNDSAVPVKPVPTPARTSTPLVTRPVATPTPEPTGEPDGPVVTPSPEPDYGNITLPVKTPRPHGYYARKPAKVSVVGGNYQKASPGARLPAPLVIYVTDEDGNPTEATVQFTILGGDAKVSSRQVRTDQRGLASTFIIINGPGPVRIVAEVMESPGLSTIAYANSGSGDSGNQGTDNNPIIKSSHPTNQPGFPAAIAFYSLKSQNTDSIEKTGVVQLEIGVTDFRNQPVSTPVRFAVLKGKITVLNQIVQTNSQGKGICYVDLGSSMGIFTVEAQSLENPDLKAVFKSGPQIRSGPSTHVVKPGTERTEPDAPAKNDSSMSVPPPAGSSPGGTPALIAVISGGGQAGKVNTKLPDPLEIIVTDSQGKPVADTMVSFIVFRGSAKLEKSFARTDSEGKVKNYVTLGGRAGTVEIAVRLRDNKKLRTTIELSAEK